MKKRITSYLDYIDNLLMDEEKRDDEYWDKVIEKHLIQIQFFSHERLVHLIVFALVAVCTVMSILKFITDFSIGLLLLIVMFFVLLIPYCAHYYLLENSVQKMYDQYDEMVGKKEKYFSMK